MPLSAQTVKELGRMWTFENAPVDWIQKEYGFKPTKKWLERARLSSLRFGEGCSASFVSPRGLIMTNHHCARGNISENSPANADWLGDGFFAKTGDDEVRLRGLTVQQLIAMRDVTAKMNEGLDDAEDTKARQDILNRNRRLILGAAKEKYPEYKPEIVTLYQGGMYQLYVYKIYKDVRLVAAPPLACAKFGGDPDNFTYPRFSLDYTFCRAYENDKPADTSEHYFKWRTDGPKEGDATFVTGNPGSTGRLDTIAQMEFMRDTYYPERLQLIRRLIARAEQQAESNPKAAKAMRSRILSLENARKAFTGYLDGLKKAHVMETKRKAEQAIRKAVAASDKLSAKYGHAWKRIEDLKAEKTKAYNQGGPRSPAYAKIQAEEAALKKLIGEAFFAVYGTKVPPDATFTLRLSDGFVKGFPMNGTIAPFYTSLYGLYARHTEFGGKKPFDLPKEWLELEGKLDLKTPFNLVSTNDIIGGNSGSPMVNKDLEVVGLVFDGNIESLSNRFVYMDDIPRTVCVHPAIIILSLRDIYGMKKLADEIEGKSKR